MGGEREGKGRGGTEMGGGKEGGRGKGRTGEKEAPHFSKVPIWAPSLFACEKRLYTASGQVFVAME